MIWESGGTGLLLRAFPLRVFAVPVGILLSALLDRDYAPLVYLVWIPIERVILLRFRGRFIDLSQARISTVQQQVVVDHIVGFSLEAANQFSFFGSGIRLKLFVVNEVGVEREVDFPGILPGGRLENKRVVEAIRSAMSEVAVERRLGFFDRMEHR